MGFFERVSALLCGDGQQIINLVDPRLKMREPPGEL
jgi:hypothetical protein